MRPTRTAFVFRALSILVVLLAPAAPRVAQAVVTTGVQRDWLPDSSVMATVGARKITVYDYRAGYYLSDATLRPRPDSLGRVQFLQDLVDKETLGQAAQQTGYQFAFEDRAEFREYRNSVLSNMLFMRAVRGQSTVSDDSLRRIVQFYSRELKLRLLYFPTRDQAEFTRLQLIGGRLTWAAALARYPVRTKNVVDGVSDWYKFDALPLDVALQIWPLRLGETSPIILASSGYHVAQVFQERPRPALPFSAMRSIVKHAVEDLASEQRRIAIQLEAKQGMNVAYDTTNVRWAASFFREAMRVDNEGLASHITIDENVPEFSPTDTARTLVTWKGGRLSVGDIVHSYTDTQPVLRPSVNTPERMLSFIDAVMLRPKMIEIAEQRGLDKDSLAIVYLDRKREEILVTHMVEDSVLSRIQVTKEERQAYYRDNPRAFTAYPTVRFAMLVRASKAAADSVKLLLDHGANVDSLVQIDTARGIEGSGTNVLRSNEPSDYHKVLFEELRPGKTAIFGPDKAKLYGVLHEISYDPGQIVPYQQLEASIDESVRNIKGDRAMRVFIEGLRARFPVVSHPERVMLIHLLDPASEGD